MYRLSFVLALVFAFVACAPATDAPATESIEQAVTAISLGATADTYVRNGHPNKNQGDETLLRVRKSGKNRALIAFDSAAIASAVGSGTVASATLELPISFTANNWGDGRPIDVHAVTTAWTELGATWSCAIDSDTGNQQPDCSGATEWTMGGAGPFPWNPVATDSAVIDSGMTGTVSFDVTSDVVAMLSGADYTGWIVKKQNEGQNGRIEFASRETGNGPRLVLDVQGDCSNTGSVGLLGLGAPSILAAHLHPTMLRVADLDGDTDLDLVIPTWATRAVSVYKNNGDGTFSQPDRYFVPDFTDSVAVADLSGDEIPDLALTHGNSVAVLVGAGDGTFAAPQSYVAGAGARRVAIADVDEDAIPDVVVGGFNSQSVEVLLGIGGGLLGPATSVGGLGDGPMDLEVADVNEDGHLDVLVMLANPRVIAVLAGDGTAGFAALPTVVTGNIWGELAVADLDCDNHLDVIVASHNDAFFNVLGGNGDGTFTVGAQVATGDRPFDPFVADLNGDGALDVVVANALGTSASILWGLGAAQFGGEQVVELGAGPASTAVIDVSGDGVLDMVTALAQDAEVDVRLGP